MTIVINIISFNAGVIAGVVLMGLMVSASRDER